MRKHRGTHSISRGQEEGQSATAGKGKLLRPEKNPGSSSNRTQCARSRVARWTASCGPEGPHRALPTTQKSSCAKKVAGFRGEKTRRRQKTGMEKRWYSCPHHLKQRPHWCWQTVGVARKISLALSSNAFSWREVFLDCCLVLLLHFIARYVAPALFYRSGDDRHVFRAFTKEVLGPGIKNLSSRKVGV